MTEAKPTLRTSTSSKGKVAKIVDLKDSDSYSTSSESTPDDEEKVDQIGGGVGSALTIDREEYLLALRDLTNEKNMLQIKNNILHRRLGEYYKKRKQEHVLKPIERSMDLEEKYQQKLYAYEELKEKSEREIADISSKLSAVQLKRDDCFDNVQEQFDSLQLHEKETGTGLIYFNKGKPIADKTVQRFLTLQRRKSEQCSALRLRYIRARNAVADLENVVKSLEKIGTGLYVAQYEQLFIDQQNLSTKIEEREDELIKNRTKCTEHNQILAHIREKMNHTDVVIDITECDLGDAEIEFQAVREELGKVKTCRDKLRWALEGERVKAGLLTRKDLLRDFQDASDEVVLLRERKKCLEEQIELTANKLRAARKQMLHQHTVCDYENEQSSMFF